MTRRLRSSAVVLLTIPTALGIALGSSLTGIGLLFGIPTFLTGAIPLIFVLTAGETRVVRAGLLVMVAAVLEIWLGVSLLDETFSGDTEIGQLSILVGTLTLLAGGAILRNSRTNPPSHSGGANGQALT